MFFMHALLNLLTYAHDEGPTVEVFFDPLTGVTLIGQAPDDWLDPIECSYIY